MRLEKNIVWLFASTRSGTTWLGKELLSHGIHFIDEMKLSRHLGIPSDVSAGNLTEIEYHKLRQDYFFSTRYEETWQFYLRKMILNRIFVQKSNLNDKILVKEPSIGGFSTIARSTPNSKILILVRDGRDVVDSQVDGRIHGFNSGGRFTGSPLKPLQPAERLDFIKGRAQTWVNVMDNLSIVINEHKKELVYLVRYEDLLNETQKELQRIYDFIGIKISENELKNIIKKYSFKNIPSELKGKGRHRRIASPGKWKENFSEEEKVMMEKIMGKALKNVGYKLIF